jgi:hypothetical protein
MPHGLQHDHKHELMSTRNKSGVVLDSKSQEAFHLLKFLEVVRLVVELSLASSRSDVLPLVYPCDLGLFDIVDL